MNTTKTSTKKNRAPQTFMEAAQNFETSRIEDLKKSRKLAWKIAIVCTGVTSISIFAFLVALLTRPEPEPTIIQVDKSTGSTMVLRSVKDTSDKYSEVINRYWLANYVRIREDYDWFTIGTQFDAVLLLSEPNIGAEYSNKVKSDSAPLALLKDRGRIEAKIQSIAFIGDLAQVRFTTEKKSVNGENLDGSPVQKWIATIGFKFAAGLMTDQQRMVNPLGFKVISYRVDPEVITK